MKSSQLKIHKRQIRKGRVRSRVSGSESRPRLSVFRSSSHIYAQIIDDSSQKTLAQASTVKASNAGNKTDAAKLVGQAIAEKAKAAGITQVVFDRGGNKYHGRVKQLADAARESGLQF